MNRGPSTQSNPKIEIFIWYIFSRSLFLFELFFLWLKIIPQRDLFFWMRNKILWNSCLVSNMFFLKMDCQQPAKILFLEFVTIPLKRETSVRYLLIIFYSYALQLIHEIPWNVNTASRKPPMEKFSEYFILVF